MQALPSWAEDNRILEAAARLPRPDFHRQVDGDFKAHHTPCYAAFLRPTSYLATGLFSIQKRLRVQVDVLCDVFEFLLGVNNNHHVE